jgi:ABC-2 type transport system permease protein
MNIFFRELRSNIKSLVIWCVIMILLVIGGLAKFAAYYNNPASLEILSSFPKAIIDAMNLQAFNLTTLNGLYGIMFVYFGLMGGIAAAMWGSNMISKEERDKTVEFSLVLPVSRGTVVTSKALAAVASCIVFVLVTWGASALMVQQYKPDSAFFRFLTL